MPDFVKRRGKQSRPLDITDFVKPVRSAEEKALYHELHLMHTKKKRTDWLGFCRDFNLRVVTVWKQTKTLCNLYLKHEEHLQLHEKHIVSQASQAEAAHATSAIGGLPAEASSYCQQPLQLQPPTDDQGSRRGSGPGAAGGTRNCKRCKDNVAQSVLMAGHDCLLYLISIGKDPRQYAHTKKRAADMASLPTVEEANNQLHVKKLKSAKEWSGTNGRQQKRKMFT